MHVWSAVDGCVMTNRPVIKVWFFFCKCKKDDRWNDSLSTNSPRKTMKNYSGVFMCLFFPVLFTQFSKQNCEKKFFFKEFHSSSKKRWSEGVFVIRVRVTSLHSLIRSLIHSFFHLLTSKINRRLIILDGRIEKHLFCSTIHSDFLCISIFEGHVQQIGHMVAWVMFYVKYEFCWSGDDNHLQTQKPYNRWIYRGRDRLIDGRKKGSAGRE